MAIAWLNSSLLSTNPIHFQNYSTANCIIPSKANYSGYNHICSMQPPKIIKHNSCFWHLKMRPKENFMSVYAPKATTSNRILIKYIWKLQAGRKIVFVDEIIFTLFWLRLYEYNRPPYRVKDMIQTCEYTTFTGRAHSADFGGYFVCRSLESN